jgi:hypothetical protein
MKRVAILGSGAVGDDLSNGFLSLGYEVMRGTRDVSKLEDWKSRSGPKASISTFKEAATFADIIILAVKGSASESVTKTCGDALNEKVVIDATNPIADITPQNGVLHFFTTYEESLMERLQKIAPKAHFVKAFSCVGSALMVKPDFGDQKPSMFICGNNQRAKQTVREILSQFGWKTEDMGSVEAARAIEPLCILWCIPGLRERRWNHAFKLLRK